MVKTRPAKGIFLNDIIQETKVYKKWDIKHSKSRSRLNVLQQDNGTISNCETNQ